MPFESRSEMTYLLEEFTSYQLLEREDIPELVWESAVVVDDGEARHYQMNLIWNHKSNIRSSDGTLKFGRLSKVALLVLPIPHSNAEEDRVVSLITKNKICFSPSLKLDGNLSSIITVKLANLEPCH